MPGQPSAGALWRWTQFGVRAAGQAVRLKHIRVGRRIYTTRAWLNEFFEASAALNARTPAGRPTTAALQPTVAHAAAVAALEEAGL